MSLLDELYPATFRGVPFEFKGASRTSGGRKTVVHEYPNTDKRYVEDLGKLPRVFSLTGIIHGDGYLVRRDSLQMVLEQPGIGLLTHPFYGVILVTADPYMVVESDENLGIAVFNLTFRVSSENIFPSELQIAIDIVNDLVNGTKTSAAKDIKDIFHSDRKYPNNTVSASEHLDKITDTFNSAINSHSTDIEKKNKFISSINSFDSNKFILIQDPESLGNELVDLYDDLNNLGLSDDDILSVNRLFFDFDFDELHEEPLTVQRVERAKNSLILKSVINSLSLIYSYRVAADKEYKTEEEIDDVFNSLEDQYKYLISDSNISNDTFTLIEELRNNVRKVFDKERISAYKITEIETKDIPLSVLTYSYYGNTDNAESLMYLNKILTPAVVSGNIKIFSETS